MLCIVSNRGKTESRVHKEFSERWKRRCHGLLLEVCACHSVLMLLVAHEIRKKIIHSIKQSQD